MGLWISAADNLGVRWRPTMLLGAAKLSLDPHLESVVSFLDPACAEINAVDQHKKPKDTLAVWRGGFSEGNFVWNSWLKLSTIIKLGMEKRYQALLEKLGHHFEKFETRTWLSLLATSIVAATRTQSKTCQRPGDVKGDTTVLDPFCSSYLTAFGATMQQVGRTSRGKSWTKLDQTLLLLVYTASSCFIAMIGLPEG